MDINIEKISFQLKFVHWTFFIWFFDVWLPSEGFHWTKTKSLGHQLAIRKVGEDGRQSRGGTSQQERGRENCSPHFQSNLTTNIKGGFETFSFSFYSQFVIIIYVANMSPDAARSPHQLLFKDVMLAFTNWFVPFWKREI